MERWHQSSKRNPCPICGRVKDGDCRVRADGQMVFCHRGATQGPPEGLRAGEVLTDSDDRRWAYAGESRDGSRDGAVFVIDQAQPPSSLPACPPPPALTPVPATKKGRECLATTYQYNDNLRVVRYQFDTKLKEFQPQFFFNNSWHAGAGADIWPFYGSLDHGPATYIIEVEGEKCVDTLRAQGIAAITHPGHQRDEVSCRARYEGLRQANVSVVYYISDNDAAGRKKAALFTNAAKQANVELRVVPAESICDVPEGGSVDDMPPEQLPQLIVAALKAPSAAKITPLNRTSYAKIKLALQEFLETSPDSSADIQTAIADIASAHDASMFDTSRIWDSLQEDKRAEAEALGASAAISRRMELEERRQAFELRDYLPDSVSSAIEVLAENLSCDPLVAVSVVLTGVSGVLRAGHRIDTGDGLFVKGPVMWCLLAGPSGSGKSPVMQHLCRDRMKLVISHYNQISMDEEIKWEQMYGNLPKTRRPDKPQALRTCISNFTTESLTGIIGDNHKKGLPTFIYSEEIREILGNFDEYKGKGKGRGKETFLCLFDGNVDAANRVGTRAPMIEGKVQNALLGGVQPGVFRTMVEGGDDAGLFARCLIVPIVNEYKEPNFFRTSEELQAVYMAEQTLENFYLRCMAQEPVMLRLEQDAALLFKALHRDTYDKSQSVPLESQRAVFGKRLGYILQVALTMHLCSAAADEVSAEELFVPKRTIARAVKLVDLLQAYAILEQQESQMQRHGTFDLNRRIHAYSLNRDGCSVPDFVAHCIPNKYRREIKASDVKAAMDQMVAMNLGEWREDAAGRRAVAIFVARDKFPD